MQQSLAKNQNAAVKADIEQIEPDNGFRLFPLTPGGSPKISQQSRGVKAVQPLPQSGFGQGQPLPQGRFGQGQQMPMQNQMQAQQMPQAGFNQSGHMPQLPQNKPGHMRQTAQNSPHPMQMQQPPAGFNPMMQQQSQASHQPQQQPASPTPLPPERAADQFRRVNNGLPDGVRYEPLDEETMRLLKDNNHLPKQPTANQPSPSPENMQRPNEPTSNTPSSAIPPMIPPGTTSLSSTAQAIPTPPNALKQMDSTTASERINPMPIALSGAIPRILEGLAQDERNAQIFYNGLSENTENDAAKELLTSLSIDCHARLNHYKSILTNHCSRIFTPLETEINTALDLSDALTLAITEENKALITLSSLLDQVASSPAENAIQRIINKKLVGHQLLLSFSTRNI